MNRYSILIKTFLALFLFWFGGCQMPVEEQSINSLELPLSEMTLSVGQNIDHFHPYVDVITDNDSISYTSSNDNVINVTTSFVIEYPYCDIEAVGVGQAVLTAKSKNKGITSTCIITVVEPDPFIISYNVETDPETNENVLDLRDCIKMETDDYHYSYDMNFDWGDGSGNFLTNMRHFYNEPGIYTVKIYGHHYYIDNLGGENLIDIQQWGNVKFSDESSSKGISNSVNLQISATDIPDLSNLTSLRGFFENCTSLTSVPLINDWDTSHITDMSDMFLGCLEFNQDLSGLDTGSVTDMSGMFRGCIAFNQDLSDWDTSSVENMAYMFYSASIFNQSLASWDISNVTYMHNLFRWMDQSLSGQNVNSTLISWASQDVQDDVNCELYGPYTTLAAEEALNHLRNEHNWDIAVSYGLDNL